MKHIIKRIVKRILNINYFRAMLAFHYDAKRIVAYSPAFNKPDKTALEAMIILNYHIIEKGITMPNRHLPFGQKVVMELIAQISEFENSYGMTKQVEHAIKVLKEYQQIHRRAKAVLWDGFERIDDFLANYNVAPTCQHHFSREAYFLDKNKRFPEFAQMRHTIRNYSSSTLDVSKIKEAVQLAVSAPTACNRQHIRVRCVVNKKVCDRILEEQGGNRGFGKLADKVLIVTADLREEIGGIRERYDPYVNGGIFLMNLCYALSYYEIAHCILTCSLDRVKDVKIRTLGKIPDNEVVVAMLCCGEPADSFDVAISPKRDVNEVLSIVEEE